MNRGVRYQPNQYTCMGWVGAGERDRTADLPFRSGYFATRHAWN